MKTQNAKRRTQNARHTIYRRLAIFLFAFCVLRFALLGADPPTSQTPEALVRLGNAAYLRGDFDAAARLYAAASERTTDPGLVAFNEAAVYLQTGDVREAELHYLRTLDDAAAPPDRRAKALYNRGVCLLARGGSAAVYRTAVACFEQSLELTSGNDPLAADARQNLELAKLLWNQARTREKVPPKPSDLPPDAPPEPLPPQAEEDDGIDLGASPSDTGEPVGMKREPLAGPPPAGSPRETNQQAPGAGNLPVIPDSDQLQRLSPEDTRALLQRVANRLEKERRDAAKMLAEPERPNVRDW
jgi:tetratricopeptide (TPR) repeat protein